jgi:hypothetical protein
MSGYDFRKGQRGDAVEINLLIRDVPVNSPLLGGQRRPLPRLRLDQRTRIIVKMSN